VEHCILTLIYVSSIHAQKFQLTKLPCNTGGLNRCLACERIEAAVLVSSLNI